ncbi:MAG TPA: sigma-70 family RNA polymerase sigma factor [Planctomycetota bacterium]|nr:sigma-70 family RNA polymerase sigma factor [Planctomycetota bacterium]
MMTDVELLPEDTDEALADRASRGDRAAEATLALRLYPGVHALATRLLRDPEAARDATQEAFVRAFSRLDQFDRSYRFSAWIFRILVNLIRDERRRSGRIVTDEAVVQDREDRGPGPGILAIREEDVRRARSALDELSDETRLAVLLFFQEGLSGREVAFALNLTPTATRIKICRGLALIRLRLRDDS